MSEFFNALNEVSVAPDPDEGVTADLTELISADPIVLDRAEEGSWNRAPMNQMNFFGLISHPFSDAVNPDFFYSSRGHERALRKMAMTVEDNISLGLVHGKSGTGKSLLSVMLLKHLDPEKYRSALVLVSPGMTKTSLLKEILRELGEYNEKLPSKTQDLLDLLHEQIIDLYSHQRRLVILIDEAHFLSSGALHLLRTISNLETPQQKLTTCLLFSEDLFLRRLSHPSYQSLRNRMYMKVRLSGMEADETTQYIKYRLLAAGCKEPMFDEAVYAEIQKATDGVARDISRVCHNCLAEGFLQKKKTVDVELLRNVLDE
ncbi:MAG: AAA family ATPase [Deltaproteobacteria bacterium]|nr:AAA family ATPase [Deltaproteobacteria bacterium]